MLRQEGRVLEVEPLPGGEAPEVVRVLGTVGAGFADLNPAVVTITVREAEGGAEVLVRGTAKEGPLRQRAGEAAAWRIVAAFDRRRPL